MDDLPVEGLPRHGHRLACCESIDVVQEIGMRAGDAVT